MYRKILGICMALVALAVVVPASASAALTLEDTVGLETRKIEPPKLIKAVSEGTSLFEGGGIKVECNENFLTGEVIKNDGTNIEGTITHGQFDSNLNVNNTECKSGLGPANVTLPLTNGTIEPKKHWCIKTNTGEDTFTFTGNDCGKAGALTFAFNFTTIFGPVECKYERAAGVTGTFTTETAAHNPATLALIGNPVFVGEVGNPETCPKEGVLKSLNFRLYTDTAASNATGEWDDAASTGDPIWISDKV